MAVGVEGGGLDFLEYSSRLLLPTGRRRLIPLLPADRMHRPQLRQRAAPP
ncbi:MAG TPA: hypothetical protein PK765_04980 [bacterium]|nr:hypothetical protein [bacterium]